MREHLRTAILTLILLILMSGLYIWSQIVSPQAPVEQPVLPFDGMVPSEIVHGDITKKQVIFTFDAGSGDVSMLPILAALKKHGVTGTFFMTGQWALRHPELVRSVAAAGHSVYNHTYNHPYLTQSSDIEIANQLKSADDVISGLTGSTTRPYFRAPYGDRNTRVLTQAAQAGFRSVYWTIDALDWQEGETDDMVMYRVLSSLHPGMIVLMHVGDTITGSILDRLFSEIESRGYRITSLDENLSSAN